jgi:hypothetical protein
MNEEYIKEDSGGSMDGVPRLSLNCPSRQDADLFYDGEAVSESLERIRNSLETAFPVVNQLILPPPPPPSPLRVDAHVPADICILFSTLVVP